MDIPPVASAIHFQASIQLNTQDDIDQWNGSVYIQKVNPINEPLIASYEAEMSREMMEFKSIPDLSNVFEKSTSKERNSSDEYVPVSDFYIIYTHGVPCGYIQYSLYDGKVALIEKIFIENSFRRQGIGSKTFKALECHLRKQEIDSMCLTVLEANQATLKLYQKIGFVIIRSFFSEMGSGFLMQKNLSTL